MQPGFELEEVQVAPRARQAVVHGLRGYAAAWADERLCPVHHIEVDAGCLAVSSFTSATAEGACRAGVPANNASI